MPVIIGGVLLLSTACGDKDKKTKCNNPIPEAVSGVYSVRYSLDEGEWIETTATVDNMGSCMSAILTMPQSTTNASHLIYIGLPLETLNFSASFNNATVHIGSEVLEGATINISGAFDYVGGGAMPYHLHFSGKIIPAPYEDEEGEIVQPDPIDIVARDIRMPEVD